jgi:putative SOS response-associated peptidase YedK
VAAVRRTADAPARELVMLRWGLIPSWAKDPKIGYRMINARAESVAEKPSFRTAFQRRRCLILADGYYEWQKTGTVKQPYFIHLRDDIPFALAGLWESWRDENDQTLETCTIITTDASALTRRIHDRMPVILDDSDYDLWLDVTIRDRQRLEPLLHPYEDAQLIASPISTYVNNVKHDDAKCIETT